MLDPVPLVKEYEALKAVIGRVIVESAGVEILSGLVQEDELLFQTCGAVHTLQLGGLLAPLPQAEAVKEAVTVQFDVTAPVV